MDVRNPSGPASSHSGHSADVKLFLHINNQTIDLVQVSDTSIKPAVRQVVPAGSGNLEVQVDRVSYFRKVTVLPGNSPGDWIAIA